MSWKPLFDPDASSSATYRGYLLALALTIIAVGIHLPLATALDGDQPFEISYLSVALAAWLAGTRPAILAAVACLILGNFFAMEPRFAFTEPSIPSMILYGVVSGSFIVLARFARRAESLVLTNARKMQETQGELQRRHALLEGLTASVLDGMLIVSPNGKMLFANEQFQRMWNFPPEVLATQSDETALDWAETQVADPKMFREGVTLAYRRKSVVRGELAMKDGRVFERYGAPVVKLGMHHGWVWTFRDITARKKVESQLRESENHFRELLKREADIRQTLELAMQAGRIGTFSWHTVSDRHVWSPETEGFFGYAAGEFPGTTEGIFARIHPADRDLLAQMIRSGFEQKVENFSAQYRSLRPDSSVAWLSVRGRVEYDAAGKPGRLIGVMVDITAIKQGEEALASARNQLAEHAAILERTVNDRTAKLTETVQDLEAFSYSLSHDLRAPLRAMKGFAQILEADHASQLDPVATGYLRKISRAAERLDQLIEDVLTYSQIVRGQVELQPIDIEKLAHELIDENPALQPPRAEIRIESRLHPVLGHSAYLMQVLSNLVYNAVKFVAPGQLPQVHIWTECVNSEVRLFVQDNGIGIPKEAQERVFEMFQRFHGEKTYEGTGIGLTIVRKAIERMGGHISIESEPGKGTTFQVRLRKP